MSLLVFLVVVWLAYRAAMLVRPAVQCTKVLAHRRLHADHRIETYYTPRGSTVFHCWGASGVSCGDRWKIKNAKVVMR